MGTGPSPTRMSARLKRKTTAPSNEVVAPQRKTLQKKNTMEQTIAESADWLSHVNKAKKDYGREQRAVRAPDWFVSCEPATQAPSTRQSRSLSPKPKKRAPSPKSLSPKKAARKSAKPTPAKAFGVFGGVSTPANVPPTTKVVPAKWVFNSGSPSFGLYVEPKTGKAWMGNDAGAVFGFSSDGVMENGYQLGSGVKSIVADMGQWLYAGCDNGAVFDLSNGGVRVAYRVDGEAAMEAAPTDRRRVREQSRREREAAELLKGSAMPNARALAPLSVRRRHFVFCLDRSGSMRSSRLESAVDNLKMVIHHNLRPEDTISLMRFNNYAETMLASVCKLNDMEAIEGALANVRNSACGGTAFRDCVRKAYEMLDDSDVEEEQWVIALTDGHDNGSRTKQEELEQLASKRHANFLCICVETNKSVTDTAAAIANQSDNGLVVAVGRSGSSQAGTLSAQGITEAFKLISQMISSRVLWLDIRDGMLTASDRAGNLAALDIEGRPIWRAATRDSNGQPLPHSGSYGWMVRADFDGVYHGHSAGVAKYEALDGALTWFSQLSEPVLFGYLQKNGNLFVGAGSRVLVLATDDGRALRSYQCDATVTCNAASCNAASAAGDRQEHVFAADVTGCVYCFAKDGKRVWKRSLGKLGTAMSMQYSATGDLFVVTSDGFLACIDIASAASDKETPEWFKEVKATADVCIAAGTVECDTVTEAEAASADEVIVECYHQLSDETVQEISSALHSNTAVTVDGEEYVTQLQLAPGTGTPVKCIELPHHQLVFVEQDPAGTSSYAQLAKNGSIVTWCTNSFGGDRWGVCIDGKVVLNGTPILVRPLPDQSCERDGMDVEFSPGKNVQFPLDGRVAGQRFLVEELLASESGDYYRAAGMIRRIV